MENINNIFKYFAKRPYYTAILISNVVGLVLLYNILPLYAGGLLCIEALSAFYLISAKKRKESFLKAADNICSIVENINLLSNVDKAFNNMCSAVINSTSCELCLICSVEKSNNLKILAASVLISRQETPLSEISVSYSANEALSKSINEHSAQKCMVGDLPPIFQFMIQDKMSQIQIYPCISGSNVYALMILARKPGDRRINLENRIIAAISGLIAFFLQACDSKNYLKENLRKICFVADIVSKLGPQASTDEVKHAIVNSAISALDTEYIALFTIDPMTGEISAECSDDISESLQQAFLDAYGYMIIDREHNGTFVIDDFQSISENRRIQQAFCDSNISKIAAHPIRSQTGVAGLLVAFYTQNSNYEDSIPEIIEAISGQASTLMSYALVVDQSRYLLDDLAGANQKLSMQAIKDGLTGLANHRCLQETLSNICHSTTSASGRVVSFIMVDVDHFKTYNDTYGHQEGDNVLRNVAKIMSSKLRQGDVAARYGGEEFCLILKNIEKTEATKIADRIREAISQHKCGKCSVTVSMGVAECPGDASTPGELIEKADRALYHAKVTGRNRVIMWGDAHGLSGDFEEQKETQKTVLVVDDNKKCCNTILPEDCKLYKIEIAYSLDEATELLRTRAFDITFIAHEVLPEKSIQALGIISCIHPHMPVVLVSNHISPEDSKEALRKGATDILLRPFDFDEASMIIERCLERQRIERCRLFEKSSELMLQAIEALVAAIDAKDPYTAGHSIRVTSLSLAIADEMHLSNEEKYALDLAAKLHDIGKLALPESALNKQSPLTEDEWQAMREHPVQGSKIVGAIDELAYVSTIIRHHHERIDGTGYPDGLRGNAIPFLSRIIAVADSYEAMTSKRAHRSMLTPCEAIEELECHSGTHYCPDIVQALKKKLIEDGEISAESTEEDIAA